MRTYKILPLVAVGFLATANPVASLSVTLSDEGGSVGFLAGLTVVLVLILDFIERWPWLIVGSMLGFIGYLYAAPRQWKFHHRAFYLPTPDDEAQESKAQARTARESLIIVIAFIGGMSGVLATAQPPRADQDLPSLATSYGLRVLVVVAALLVLYLIVTDTNRRRIWKYLRPPYLRGNERQDERPNLRGRLIAAVSVLGLLLSMLANVLRIGAFQNLPSLVRTYSSPVIFVATAVLVIYLIATDPNR